MNNFCFERVAFLIMYIVTLVLPIPHPDKPEEHEPWCPLGKNNKTLQKNLSFLPMQKVFLQFKQFHKIQAVQRMILCP